MYWYTLMALVVVAGGIVGGAIGGRLARRFPEASSARLAIYAAVIVALIIVGISAIFTVRVLTSSYSTTREYEATTLLFFGILLAAFAAGAGEIAALWVIRRNRR